MYVNNSTSSIVGEPECIRNKTEMKENNIIMSSDDRIIKTKFKTVFV